MSSSDLQKQDDTTMKFKQRYDYEGFTLKSGELHRIVCCDCGLVHDMVLISKDGKRIGVAFARNKKATKKRRKK